MAKIYRYQKATDKYTTHCLRESTIDFEKDGSSRITELCTIDGITYVSVPDSVELSKQIPEIMQTLSLVDATDIKTIDVIKRSSPHIQLINDRVVERIRSIYSLNDEIKMLRLAPSEEATAYHLFVEECRALGKSEKKNLLGI